MATRLILNVVDYGHVTRLTVSHRGARHFIDIEGVVSTADLVRKFRNLADGLERGVAETGVALDPETIG